MSSRSNNEVRVVADRLHSASIRLLRRLRLEDARSGIGPAQLSALSVLVFGGPMSLKELANAEQVRPPTMSRVVAGLARGGLVKREIVGEDRRRLRIAPTARGVKVMQAGRARRVEQLAGALASLDAAQLRELGRAAETMLGVAERA